MKNFLGLLLALPLLFWLPGYWLGPIFLKNLSKTERYLLAPIFSLTAIYLSLHLLERLTTKFTPLNIATVIATLNMFCFMLNQAGTGFLANLRDKFHKADQK